MLAESAEPEDGPRVIVWTARLDALLPRRQVRDDLGEREADVLNCAEFEVSSPPAPGGASKSSRSCGQGGVLG
jgi:hypothetical protein